ncbi:type II toxin-antitoxin system antitoxin DNA ADP-ribosyl glycohydrolase DarG [Orrella daihaiensis]|uniref:type II toxin-antitoxin system antitoxin DNA ADP-ribosyl glycohydrolase DarG n=1 Tax=Orrella daihaiensis TaxID=2782176 RepID=UPI001FB396B3|nr:macro domain-containing protein [Orrella daihaiensis]
MALITYKTGDILRERSQALVNTVNCVGVMGRGVALQFKKAFPDNFKAYAQACRLGKVVAGEMFVYETNLPMNPRFIINFPTKRHWRDKSRIEDIESGLRALVSDLRRFNIESVAIPALGCGLGGLDWDRVSQLIETIFSELPDVQVTVFEPQGAPAARAVTPVTSACHMTTGRAALVALMSRYLQGLMDPAVSLLEIHKLLYFLQLAGEPLRLRYKQGFYGPYAENLRHVLHAIEGQLLVGYADGGDAPDKELELLPGALEMAIRFLEGYPETSARVDRVSWLVEGFESSFGLELLSTVHWVQTQSQVSSMSELIRLTYEWGERKRQFTPRQIELANTVLSQKGWLN